MSNLNEKMKSSTAALDKLREHRAATREAAETKLDAKRNDFSNRQEPASSTVGAKLKNISIKGWLTIGAGLVAVVVVVQIINVVRANLRPGWILDDHQVALESKQYEAAADFLYDYLRLEPEDWNHTVQAGELYLQLGDTIKARTLFARLLTNSPLTTDAEIQFLNGLAHLPNIPNASRKMSELLVSLDTFVPALVFRGVMLADTQPERSAELFTAAVNELERLDPNQDKYQRYQQLLGLFLVNICRKNRDLLDGSVQPQFSLYPASLPSKNLLFVYGVDPSLSTNFCGIVPLNVEWLINFDYPLETLVHFFQAYASLRAQDYAAANTAIGKSIGTGNLQVASFLDGILQALAGRFDAANNAFLRTGGSSDLATLSNLAVVQLLQGPGVGWTTATETLHRALSTFPNNGASLNNTAILYLVEGRLGQARNDLTLALENDPNYLYALYNLAVLNYVEGDYESTNDSLASIAEKSSLFPGLYYYHGISFGRRGDVERSLNNLRRAITSVGYDVLANIALGDYYQSLQGTLAQTADITALHYQRAYDINKNNFEAAFKLAVIQAKTDDAEQALDFADSIKLGLSEWLSDSNKSAFEEQKLATRAEILNVGGLDGAEAALRQATEELTDEGLRKNAALQYTTLLLAKDTEESIRSALDVTRTILPVDPKNPALLVARAQALAKAKDINQALTIIDSAQQKDPTNASVLMTKGDILALDQRWDQAVDLYQQAFGYNTNDTTPLAKAILLLEEHDGKSETLESLRTLLAYVKENPTDSSEIGNVIDGGAEEDDTLTVALVARATSEEEIIAVNEEITSLTQHIANNSVGKYPAYIRLGALHSLLNEVDLAIENMLLATKLPNVPAAEQYTAWQNLSQLYIVQKSYELASESLTRALSLNPPNEAKLLMLRAGVREKFNPTSAIEDYTQVISLRPNFFPALFRRGINKLDLEDGEGAIDDFTRALQINPDHIGTFRARRSAYGLIGDRQGAAKDAEMINLLAEKAKAN